MNEGSTTIQKITLLFAQKLIRKKFYSQKLGMRSLLIFIHSLFLKRFRERFTRIFWLPDLT